MTSAHGPSQRLRGALVVAVLAVLMTVGVAIVVSGRPTGPAPLHPAETTARANPTDRPRAPSPGPTAKVRCTEETGPLAPGLDGPACPSAVLAVEIAVAPVRLPIERIVVEPGPFYCDLLWPGVQTAPVCIGYAVQPGQFMHAWVSFAGSPKVAVVMLGLNLPVDDASPPARPPWQTSLVTVELPPNGWVMP